ncbi:cytochrome-c oxidase, cbb3-type subunit III [Methylocella silvestris]|uniref:Cbb3-type cytochrome c oxidase subunit n=1 Tax=Methylocella silvestris TaxID=199596 RepID=A0A2J7TLS8_METSI|nr:cytochrome-c oxidase, cbb3-type subunit III [Methylocella silvestris]PNG27714.1 cytochrome-c oxidase, cbb3-type subunit III [Methylocella silvestris]
MADHAHGGDYDAATGKTTTGHSWDGISELNTPLPRWWLYTLYGCIVWAIIYWVLFPAWPWFGGATKGLLGWNSRTVVARELDELRASRSAMNDKLAAASLQQIEATPELLAFARAEGAAAFAQNCSPCHGAGAQGSRGYPNLNADRWLWGGTLDQIHTTITHGARWTADPDTHAGVMPSFGRDGLLNKEEISTIADYVRTLSGNAPDAGADLAKGKQLFIDNCSPCHGEDGKGNVDVGAANLTTQVWLYGPTKADIMHRIEVGGGGVMPAWKGRLDESTIKALTVFVHTLGGGK